MVIGGPLRAISFFGPDDTMVLRFRIYLDLLLEAERRRIDIYASCATPESLATGQAGLAGQWLKDPVSARICRGTTISCRVQNGPLSRVQMLTHMVS